MKRKLLALIGSTSIVLAMSLGSTPIANAGASGCSHNHVWSYSSQYVSWTAHDNVGTGPSVDYIAQDFEAIRGQGTTSNGAYGIGQGRC
jgi:hypothetical protein